MAGAGPAVVAAGAGRGPVDAAASGARRRHARVRRFNRPTDVAWDAAGNIYVADGIGTNNRIAKFDKDGNFIKQWGSTGAGHGQFNGVKALAIDAQGNVYVADAGNKRIQVFDGDGTFKSQFTNIGTPLRDVHDAAARRSISTSRTPATRTAWTTARSTRCSSTARSSASSASAGKLPKEFGLANSIDCRSENELLVGEMTNWRVQRITLKR